MASQIFHDANTENGHSTIRASLSTPAVTNRNILADVSPNLPRASPAASSLGRKPLNGSPLKRSFHAAIDSGEGLLYLKRRKVSSDEFLDSLDEMAEERNTDSQAFGSMFRPTLPEHETNPPFGPIVDAPSPTEPNTPSEGEITQDSSAERKSFSSLINYDPSSQPSNLVLTGVSRAEMLKLRLRVAMYKVRTNQTHVPFAELRIEPRPGPKSTNEAVEEAVASLRREAQLKSMSAATTSSIPKLLPGPILRPTAYSSRFVSDSAMASSPPFTGSPERLTAAQISTLTPQRDGGYSGGTPTGAARWRGPTEQELTSSVVKGRVAEGLLGLRHAV